MCCHCPTCNSAGYYMQARRLTLFLFWIVLSIHFLLGWTPELNDFLSLLLLRTCSYAKSTSAYYKMCIFAFLISAFAFSILTPKPMLRPHCPFCVLGHSNVYVSNSFCRVVPLSLLFRDRVPLLSSYWPEELYKRWGRVLLKSLGPFPVRRCAQMKNQLTNGSKNAFLKGNDAVSDVYIAHFGIKISV